MCGLTRYRFAVVNFWLQADPMFLAAAPVNRHVLVYHRGVGVDVTEGMFIMQKVSLLVLYYP